ncbi:hypothetical protein MCBRY_003713 [Methylocystis bryophila]
MLFVFYVLVPILNSSTRVIVLKCYVYSLIWMLSYVIVLVCGIYATVYRNLIYEYNAD